ncbi:hypothetical protein [Streptomyces californicus]|uniref:hypothetical protein n=1 Tax=Streptomyces californicus TaxID=67351 RepID=UPI00379E612C
MRVQQPGQGVLVRRVEELQPPLEESARPQRQIVRVAESRGTRLEALLPEEPAGAGEEEVAEAEPGGALP